MPPKKRSVKKRSTKKRTTKKVGRKVAKRSKIAKARIETFPVETIEDAPYNPRTITAAALKGLAASLESFGVLSPPVVNVAGGKRRLVGGHQRMRVIRESGASDADVIAVELDDEQERRANLLLNNPAIQGEFVPDLTREVLARIADLADPSAAATLGKLRIDDLIKQLRRDAVAVAGVDDVVRQGSAEPDSMPTLSRTSAVSQLGETYALGDHLLCCSAPGGVQAEDVFGPGAFEMAFTRLVSPKPFGDEYLHLVFSQCLSLTSGGCYVATSTARLAQVQTAFIAAGGHWSNTILAHGPDPKGSRRRAYEDVTIPILYGWREGATRMFFGDRTQANAWTLKKAPPPRDLPVEAAVRHLLNSSKAGGTVFDPVAERGTTVIAAEKTNRALRGYVRSAKEMDRVRARWTRFVHGPEADWRLETEAL